MANELNETQQNKKNTFKSLADLENQKTSLEIDELINNPEFQEFIQTISDSINDGMTFDEILSSNKVLSQALKILKERQPIDED
jgi:hypothetical protein